MILKDGIDQFRSDFKNGPISLKIIMITVVLMVLIATTYFSLNIYDRIFVNKLQLEVLVVTEDKAVLSVLINYEYEYDKIMAINKDELRKITETVIQNTAKTKVITWLIISDNHNLFFQEVRLNLRKELDEYKIYIYHLQATILHAEANQSYEYEYEYLSKNN